LLVAIGVDPVVAGMIENDIEQNAYAALVCFRDQLNHVLTIAESRIDVEEVLDGVAVIAVKVGALFEGRTNPKRGYAEPIKIVQLQRDSI
jgi:hypothetical protein